LEVPRLDLAWERRFGRFQLGHGSELVPFRLAVAFALIAAIVIPDGAVDHAPVLCPFRLMTGRPCPACGLTRSWIALMHGNLRESIAFHPLGPLTVMAAILVVLGVHQRFPGLIRLINTRPVLAGGAAIVLAVWVVRFFTVRW